MRLGRRGEREPSCGRVTGRAFCRTVSFSPCRDAACNACARHPITARARGSDWLTRSTFSLCSGGLQMASALPFNCRVPTFVRISVCPRPSRHFSTVATLPGADWGFDAASGESQVSWTQNEWCSRHPRCSPVPWSLALLPHPMASCLPHGDRSAAACH